MRKRKQPREYATVTRRFFRPEITVCLTCQTPLRRYATLSHRTVITLDGPVGLIHRGYRCPNAACATHLRSYRSAAADALALPGFTFGIDIVILVGHLRLSQHQTLDEVYHTLLERLAPFGLTISRREVLYLFDAYCTLLRAASTAAQDSEWLAQVQANGGLIISIDGIQPDKGNETVYLVRDVLTGRVLTADNVRSSDKEVMKRVLAPVVADSACRCWERSATRKNRSDWRLPRYGRRFRTSCVSFMCCEKPRVPSMNRTAGLSVQMRKAIQQRVRPVRRQLEQQSQTATGAEQEQLAVLADYAKGGANSG